ncbi:MAG: glycine cleavage system protein GcvH [Jatrophihabitans sp.]
MSRADRIPQEDTHTVTESSNVPTDVKYTADHEWARVGDGADGRPVVRIGVTDYAQSSLGDVVYVQLPEVGTTVTTGEVLGEIESTKSVSDLFAPVTGTVVARNDSVEATPELTNTDPYGGGWLIEISVADGDALADLLEPEAYSAQLKES